MPEDQGILDADIKGFFNNINHDWLLNNLYLNSIYKPIVEAWLKSGAIDNGIFVDTDLGTPQIQVKVQAEIMFKFHFQIIEIF